MKHLTPVAALLALALAGCANRNAVGITNQQQPGPLVGRAIGTGVGAVGANVVGAGVGVVEGVSGATATVFDNTQRVIRYWREEKTPDGRVILVPEDWLVDADGRVIRKIK